MLAKLERIAVHAFAEMSRGCPHVACGDRFVAEQRSNPLRTGGYWSSQRYSFKGLLPNKGSTAANSVESQRAWTSGGELNARNNRATLCHRQRDRLQTFQSAGRNYGRSGSI